MSVSIDDDDEMVKKNRGTLSHGSPRRPIDRWRASQPYVVAGAGGKARVRVTFDRGARLDDARALVTKRRVPIARVASRACRCGRVPGGRARTMVAFCVDL